MSRIAHSLLLSFAEKYLLLMLNLLATMLLARLLSPDEIGAYALGAVLAGLLQALRDFGVGSYLIRTPELSIAHLRAALATSLLVACVLASLLFALSWPATDFYHDARVGIVLRWLALNFLCVPYAALALALLRRQLRFGRILAINLASAISQLTIGVACAWAGLGYMSLVWGATAAAFVTLVMSICLHPEDLPFLPSSRGMRQVLAFGSLSTLGSVVDEAGVAAPELILGRLAGTQDVALYGKAIGLLNVFNQLVTSAVSPVIFPWFSAQARAGTALQQAFLRTASYMAALAWPFFGFIALNTPQLVKLLYGQQWDACVPLIRVMCLASALYSMFSMARYLFVALGAVAAQARLDAVAVAARVVLVMLAAPHGLLAVAWAVVGGSLVRCGLSLTYLWRFAGVAPRAMWRPMVKSLLLAICSLTLPYVMLVSLLPSASLSQLAGTALGMLPGWLLGIRLLYPELAALAVRAGRLTAERMLGT